jgi:SecY interacting protein Syd
MGVVRESLARVLKRRGRGKVEYDPEWPSPCPVGLPDEDGMVEWQPVAIANPPDFGFLEQVIGRPVRPEVVEFFSSYFAGDIEARHSGEVVLLHTLWNSQEIDRLQEALVSHVRRQIEDGFSVTLPIANTDSDLFFAVDNATGAVVLQEPGHGESRVVASSLEAFLDGLESRGTPVLDGLN